MAIYTLLRPTVGVGVTENDNTKTKPNGGENAVKAKNPNKLILWRTGCTEKRQDPRDILGRLQRTLSLFPAINEHTNGRSAAMLAQALCSLPLHQSELSDKGHGVLLPGPLQLAVIRISLL